MLGQLLFYWTIFSQPLFPGFRFFFFLTFHVSDGGLPKFSKLLWACSVTQEGLELTILCFTLPGRWNWKPFWVHDALAIDGFQSFHISLQGRSDGSHFREGFKTRAVRVWFWFSQLQSVCFVLLYRRRGDTDAARKGKELRGAFSSALQALKP